MNQSQYPQAGEPSYKPTSRLQPSAPARAHFDLVDNQDLSGVTADEAALLAAFRTVSDEYRETAMQTMRILARRFPRQRPALTLVVGQRQHQRTAGFGDPFVLLAIAVCVVILYLAMKPAPAPEPAPEPTPGASIRYAPFIFLDVVTGCEYLSAHTSTGLVPRIAADGKTHMGCKGGIR